MDIHTFHGFTDEMTKMAAPGGAVLSALTRAGKRVVGGVGDAVRSVGRSIANSPKTTVHGFTGYDFGSPTLKGIGMESVPAKARTMGLTSIPGVAKSLVRHPIATTKELAFGGNPMNLAVNVGLPVAAGAPSLMRGDESAEGGMTTGQKLVNLGAGVGSGVLTSHMPIIPGMVASGLAMYGANKLVSPQKREEQP